MKNLFSFFILSLSLQAQFQVNGLVTAASDGKPLAFASVIADNDTKTITDVDGKLQSLQKNQLILCILHRFR
jgi:hypothetical protein